MPIIIKYWLDSGANAHSCREGETTPEALGITEAKWRSLPVSYKEQLIRDLAWEDMDWGWKERDACEAEKWTREEIAEAAAEAQRIGDRLGWG